MQEMQIKALELGHLLQEHKGEKVTVLDISRLNSWTDYFVIASVNSSTHSKGLYKHIKDYAKENDLHIHLTKRKSPDGDDWNLIDFGPKAGRFGGEVVASGTPETVKKKRNSVTGPYLSGKKAIPVPKNRRIAN